MTRTEFKLAVYLINLFNKVGSASAADLAEKAAANEYPRLVESDRPAEPPAPVNPHRPLS